MVLVLVGWASVALADPPPEKPAYKMDLQPWEGHPGGTVAIARGDSSPDGDQFFLESVGVLQPVNVTLIAKNPGDKIKLILAKQRWDENLREVATGPGATVTTKLRTQGEVRMIVKAEGDPKPYFLFVWVGDEVKPDFASPVVPMKDFKGTPGAGGGSGGSAASAAIGVGVVIIIVLLLVLIIRKRGAK